MATQRWPFGDEYSTNTAQKFGGNPVILAFWAASDSFHLGSMLPEQKVDSEL